MYIMNIYLPYDYHEEDPKNIFSMIFNELECSVAPMGVDTYNTI